MGPLISWLSLPGVTLFFVLSGYLIGGILIHTLEKGRTDVRDIGRFWARRWMRTLPAYYVTLLILFALHWLFQPGFQPRAYLALFWFGQNLLSAHPVGFFEEAWSLAVEEWFYLLSPVFLWGLIRWRKVSVRQAILVTAILFTLVAWGMRLYHWGQGHIREVMDWDLLQRKQVFTRFDSLMLGVLAAYVARYHPRIWLGAPRVCLAIGIVGLLVQERVLQVVPHDFLLEETPIYSNLLYLFLNSLGTALCLPFLSQWKQAKGKGARTITFISLVSYSWYLVHMSLFSYWILRWLPLSTSRAEAGYEWALYLLYWGGSLGLAFVSYLVVEQTGIRLRERWFAKR